MEKSNRIGRHRNSSFSKVNASCSGVKRGKKFVGYQRCFFTAQGIKERAFAGVGIADQRNLRYTPAFAQFPEFLPLFLQGRNPGFQTLDVFPGSPAFFLQFHFAGTAGADASAQPGEENASSGHPGEAVILPSQFHLKFSGGAVGVLGKYLQNQAGPVQYLYAPNIF